VNTPPSVTDIPAQVVPAGGSTGPLPFTVSDAETAAADLVVTAGSDGPLALTLGGSGENRTVEVAPIGAFVGTFTVALRVADLGGLTTVTTFDVVFEPAPVNAPPAISDVPDRATTAGVPVGPLAFTVSDAETPAGELVVTAATSDPLLLPLSGIALGGAGGDRAVTVAPAPGRTGTARVTLTVTDADGAAAEDTFDVVVGPTPFPDDLAGWTAAERGGSAGLRGNVAASGGRAVLTEGDSFVTTLSRAFVVPADSPPLTLTYEALGFDGTDPGFVNDAFEAALVDPAGNPLAATFTTGRDAFFNATDGGPAATGAGTALAGGTFTVDLSGVPAGTVATLVLRLVNNDADAGSSVALSSYVLPDNAPAPEPAKFYVADPAAGRTYRYGPAGLTGGAFAAGGNPLGIASNPAGDTLWTVDGTTGVVSVVRPDGTPVGSWTATDAAGAVGVTVDGGALWLVDRAAGRVRRYDGGALLRAGASGESGGWALHPDNAAPGDLATDGGAVWVTDEARAEVFVYDPAGALVGRWHLDGDNLAPSGITLDPSGGADLWVVDRARAAVFHYRGGRSFRDGRRGAAGTFALATGNAAPEAIADPPTVDPALAGRLAVAAGVADPRPPAGSEVLVTGRVDWAPGYVVRPVASGFGHVGDIYRDPAGRLLVADLGPTLGVGPGETPVRDGRVVELRPDGTTRVVADGYFNPSAVLVDAAGALIVLDTGGFTYTGDFDGVVWRDTGTGPVAVATGFTTPLDAIFKPSDPGRILVSDLGGTRSYPADGFVAEVDLATGGVSVFFDDGPGGLINVAGLGVGPGGAVYASDNGSRNVHRLTSPTTQEPVADRPLDEVRKFGFDPAGNLVVAESGAGAIRRVAAGGRTPAPFVNGVGTPFAVLVDGDRVYFSDIGTVWVACPAGPAAVVTVDGRPATLDAAGNFFARVPVGPGRNTYAVRAADAHGCTAETTVTVDAAGGTPAGSFDLSRFVDLSASFRPEYARTSFHDDTATLYADVAVRNTGPYPADVPLLVAVRNISDPAVRVRGAAGLTPDGLPYFNFTPLVGGRTLNPDGVTGTASLAFFNPLAARFTYELVFLGRLNEAPAITTVPDLEALAGRPYRYDLAATDPDGDPVTYAVVSGPAGLAVDANTGRVTWTPTAADIGTHAVVLRASDGRGGVAEQRYVLGVIDPPPNRPPVFTSVPVVSGAVSAAYSYPATARDEDGDPLTFAVGAGPAGLAIDPTMGVVTWTPTADQVGPHAVTLTVSDGRGGTATQAFTVLVAGDVPAPPPVYDLTVTEVDPAGLEWDGQTLTVAGLVTATIKNQGTTDLGDPFEVLFFDDSDFDRAFNPAIDKTLGRVLVRGPVPAGQSVNVSAELAGDVLFAGNVVWAYVDSRNEVAEADEANNLAPSNPDCIYVPPVGTFDPVVEWHKGAFTVRPDSDQVMMAPTVIDLNADGTPDIVFSSFTGEIMSPGCSALSTGLTGPNCGRLPTRDTKPDKRPWPLATSTTTAGRKS
jgi:sugar lactone lactonase YvrE